MAQEPDPNRLRDLDAKLAKVKAAQARPAGAGKDFSQAEVAWRMVIELTSGIMIGGSIGYGLDWAFGTKPIFLILFILFGFAAGIRTVIGTARDMQIRQLKAMEAQTEAERSARTEG